MPITKVVFKKSSFYFFLNFKPVPLRQILKEEMIRNRIVTLILVFVALFGNPSFAVAQEGAENKVAVITEAEKKGEKDKKFNVSEVLFGHVADSHYWHLFDMNGEPIALALPVIIHHPVKGWSIFSASRFHHGKESYDGYHLTFGMKEKIVADDVNDKASIMDFSITKNVLSMIISVVLLLVLMIKAANKYNKNGVMKAPSGFQNALEAIIIFIRDEVAKPNLGTQYKKYFPLLLTMFFFIWINNLLGLLPGGANFTGNIAVTLCLALISFAVTLIKSNKHYWGHILNPPGIPLAIKFLVVPIEIMSVFIKPMALMIRLFANILAGHIVILSVISMIFIFGGMSAFAAWAFAPVSLGFTIFMFMLELLVGAIQAFIFATLTAVFIGQAIEGDHSEDAHATAH
jgi:F-type H+-transporting ATPase subunit a